MRFADPIFSNYKRILADKVFQQSIANTFLYLIIQVPIMLILAILLAQLLNNKDLKFKGFFRTCVFLPCATSLVSYSLIFLSLIHISEPTRRTPISYAVFCLKKKKQKKHTKRLV